MTEPEQSSERVPAWVSALRVARWPVVVLVLAGLTAVAVRELREMAREGGRAVRHSRTPSGRTSP